MTEFCNVPTPVHASFTRLSVADEVVSLELQAGASTALLWPWSESRKPIEPGPFFVRSSNGGRGWDIER